MKGHRLSEVRKTRRITQKAHAEKMGLKQAGLSQLERRDVLETRSLRAYVEALGGRLTITAEFGDGASYILSPFSSGMHKEVTVTSSVVALLNDPVFKAGLSEQVRKILGEHS